jgi:phospholipid/cholesterol/gamma-HCH transport system substrate-binding protein
MDRDRKLSLTVGGFFLLGLFGLALGILSLSAQQGIFKTRYRLVAYFDNVQGLKSGAAVRLAGSGVGQVTDVVFSSRPSGKPALQVVLQVDGDVKDRIRADSVAQISTVGLLGDQIIEISMGTAASPPLQDGDEIPTISPFDFNAMITKGGKALDAIERLASNLNEALADFDAAGGGERVADTFSALGDMVGEVQTGDGVLHNLIYEPYQGSAVENLEASLASLEDILHEVREGDGILHSLVYDEPEEQDIVLQVMQAGARLNSILAKVDRGEGTFGLMLNDPTLYEEIKMLVGGANRSTVLRSMVNMVSGDGDDE